MNPNTTEAKKILWLLSMTVRALTAQAQQDTTPPSIESAASVGGRYIGICFSETVQVNSAQQTSNYSVNNGAIPVMTATLRDGKTVLLALSSPVTGNFSVTVNNVRDFVGLSIAPNSTVSGEVWALGTDVNGTPPGVISPSGTNFSCNSGDVDVQAGGADIWGVNDEFHFVYQPRTGDFDVAVLIQRLDSTSFRAKAGLMARESLFGNSRSIQIDTNPLEDLGAAEYQAHRRASTNGNVTSWGGEPGSDLPNAWMRLKRSGDVFTAYYGTDGINWNRLAGPVQQLMSSEVLVGMETTSHDINTRTTAEYRNFGELSSAQLDPSIVALLPLENQTLQRGDPVIWLAEVPGSLGYTFQWQKDGLDLSGETGAVYRISSADLSHAGVYSVSARNRYGAVGSSSAELRVNPPSTLLIPFTNVWRYEASGTDLGITWKDPTFADASWRTGPAPLGYETNAQVLPMPVRTTIGLHNRITYYFRSQFVFTNEPADVYLRLKTLLDDGAVVYLNGKELVRVLMGEGVVGFNTTTVDFVLDAIAIEQWDHLPSSLLIRGDNKIAVEVHQTNPTSTDIFFALELVVVPLPATELSITNQPQDTLVELGKSSTLAVGSTGTGARYQWFKDGAAITGATRAVYSVTNATAAHQGTHYVVVSNSINRVQSRDAVLSVVADTVLPTVTRANGALLPTTVEITFSEAVAPATATNINNYTITNMLGGRRGISRAVMQGTSKVLLTSQDRQAQQNYFLLVRNVQDRATPPNTILANQMVPIASNLQLIPAQTEWLYYDTIVDPPLVGTAWRQPGYDTTDWFSLPAAFVYDAEALPLPLPTRTVLSQGQLTTYFRKEFNFNGGMATRLRFNHYVDDGAVFYLNGVEVFRFNMPSGIITDQTAAAAVLGKAWPIETNVPVSLLRHGTNLVAVELHGEQTFDTDLFFALELNVDMDSYPGGPLLITEHPRSQTGLEGQAASFRVVGTGATTLQWERDGQPITGANQAIYTIPSVHPSMNGATFTVVLSNASGGMLRSESATLTVAAEDEPPRLLEASGQANYVTLKFSEPLELGTATMLSNYSLRNGGQTLLIASAEVGDNPSEITLFTQELPQGVELSVRVNGVTDQAAVGNPVAVDSEARFFVPTFVSGFVKAEYYGADSFDLTWGATGFLYGHSLGQLKGHPSFPQAPKRVALKSIWELDRSNDSADFFGARISGYFVPRESGPHVFYLCTREQGELWLSSDSYPGHKVLIAREPNGAPRRFWHGTIGPDNVQYRSDTMNESAPIDLIAGRKYYMESLMKAGGESVRTENMAVAVKQPSDSGPPAFGSAPMQSILLGGFGELSDGPATITIVDQPSSQTAEEGQRLTLHVSVHSALAGLPGGNTVYYQWQRNGVDLIGATGAYYTTRILTAGDDGAEYRVIMQTAQGDRVASDAAIVRVVALDTPAFLQISKRTDGKTAVTWERSGYLLQQSETVPGFWEAASTQVSPAVIAPSEGEEFFRLIRK